MQVTCGGYLCVQIGQADDKESGGLEGVSDFGLDAYLAGLNT